MTARVEEALREFKKMLPEIKKQMGQVQQEFSKVDFKGIAKSINLDGVKKQAEKGRKIIKDAFDPSKTSFTINGKVANLPTNNGLTKEQVETKKQIQELVNELEKSPKGTAYDIILSKIHMLNRELQGLPPLVKKVNMGLSLKNVPEQNEMADVNTSGMSVEVAPSGSGLMMWDVLRAKIAQVKPYVEQFKSALKGFNSSKELELLNYKISELEEKLQGGVNGEVHLSTKEIIEAEAELERLNNKKAQLEKSDGGSSVFANMASFMESVMPKLSGVSLIMARIRNQIRQMSTGMKQGLGHVLKYAGALFSLNGIYSILSNSGSSWLSSQNAGAQQLSANIEYMKNAMGSVLAPVIQFVTGLIYNLMKAIQSVVYALFKVNIFAKASAKSYASMAGSAKKAKNETKALSGVHDEINNVQKNDGADSGGGSSGGSAPSFDLSDIDSQMSPLAQKLYDFFKPLKESWDIYGPALVEQIKITASQIGYLLSSVWGSFENIITNGTI